MKLVDPYESAPLRLGFYSLPGAGKTTLAGSFASDPRTSPVLFIDFNGNTQVLSQLGLDYGEDFAILRLDDPNELNAIYVSLRSQQKVGVLKELPTFKTIVIDCVTDMQRMVFAEEGGYADPNTLYVKPPKRTYGNFQVAGDVMMNLAESLTWLPQHVVLTFWAKKTELQAQEGNQWVTRIEYELGLDGRARNDLPGYLQSVGFLDRNPNWSSERPTAQHYNTLSFRFARDQYAKETLGFKATYKNPTARELLDSITYGENNVD